MARPTLHARNLLTCLPLEFGFPRAENPSAKLGCQTLSHSSNRCSAFTHVTVTKIPCSPLWPQSIYEDKNELNRTTAQSKKIFLWHLANYMPQGPPSEVYDLFYQWGKSKVHRVRGRPPLQFLVHARGTAPQTWCRERCNTAGAAGFLAHNWSYTGPIRASATKNQLQGTKKIRSLSIILQDSEIKMQDLTAAQVIQIWGTLDGLSGMGREIENTILQRVWDLMPIHYYYLALFLFQWLAKKTSCFVLLLGIPWALEPVRQGRSIQVCHLSNSQHCIPVMNVAGYISYPLA